MAAPPFVQAAVQPTTQSAVPQVRLKLVDLAACPYIKKSTKSVLENLLNDFMVPQQLQSPARVCSMASSAAGVASAAAGRARERFWSGRRERAGPSGPLRRAR